MVVWNDQGRYEVDRCRYPRVLLFLVPLGSGLSTLLFALVL